MAEMRMNAPDRLLVQAAAACLEVAAKRGAVALERAYERMTPSQRGAVPEGLVAELRREAAGRWRDGDCG